MKPRRTPHYLMSFLLILTLLLAACGGGAPAETTEEAAGADSSEAADSGSDAASDDGAMADGVRPGSLHNLDAYQEMTGETLEFNEAPMLAEMVAAGDLPSVEERLPENPLVMVPWNEIGEYGGAVRWDEFTVGYDHYFRHILNTQLALRDASPTTYYNAGPAAPEPGKPYILEGWEINDDFTEFTISLRKGLKWSDGVEMTTEDVRFRVEDEVFNEELNPGLTARPYIWGGEKMGLEIIDEYTFKVSFAVPYGAFVKDQLMSSWGGIARYLAPSHFFKQYHKDHTDIAEILPTMEELGFSEAEEWANFYKSVWYGGMGDSGPYMRNALAMDLPVLYPWVMETMHDDGSATLVRNPYFYAVDSAGNQLPYLDRLERQFVSDSEIMNLDIIAGKVDVQGQFIKIDDFPLFKENEDEGNYMAIPVRAWQHHTLVYFVNQTHKDPVIRAATEQFDFRRALSIALDRAQINEASARGLGTPGQMAAPSGTPLYNEELTNFAAEYDPEGAMALLDGLGYVDVDGDGFRETPDGEKFVLPFDFYEVTPFAIQGAVLAEEYWEAVGIEVDAKQHDGGQFWNLQGANEVAAGVWWANGPDFGDGFHIAMRPNAYLWWQWNTTDGANGEEPPGYAKRIHEIQNLRLQVGDEERIALDLEGWELVVTNLHTIGTFEGGKNPLILNKDLGNVQYGFENDFVAPTYWEWSPQWFYTNPDRR